MPLRPRPRSVPRFAHRLARVLSLGLVASALAAGAALPASTDGSSATTASGSDLELAASRACVGSKLGLPPRGQAYAGTVATGNVSLSQRERFYGRKVPIHRTYWGPGSAASATRTARADVANNRLPWVSFKVNGTWKENADGKYDDWARSVVRQLNGVPGPVWVAFYHEPENKGQDVRQWTRMQARFARIVHANSDNVAMTMIVMGYHQVAGTNPAYKLDRLWPGDGLIDVIGMDPYNFLGWHATARGKQTDLRPWFRHFDAFARAHGTRWGVAEIGYTHEAASKNRAWLTDTYTQLKASGGVAMSYFDSTLNTMGGTWNLDPLGKRYAHRYNVRSSVRIC